MEMYAPLVSNWSLGTQAGEFIFLPYVPGWVVGGGWWVVGAWRWGGERMLAP